MPHPRQKLSDAQLAEAVKLRAEGWYYREIAERFGVSRSNIHSRLNGTEKKRRAYKRDWERKNYRTKCVDCRGSINKGRVRCKECSDKRTYALTDAKRAFVAILWKAGWSRRDIAEAVGMTVGSLSPFLARMKRAGWDVPLRYEYPNGTPQGGASKTIPTTNQGARQRLNWAIEMGEVARPLTCDGCGEAKRVEGHHTDYTKPLDVEWLCQDCHLRAHGAEPVTEAA